jgi:hypothetical protein
VAAQILPEEAEDFAAKARNGVAAIHKAAGNAEGNPDGSAFWRSALDRRPKTEREGFEPSRELAPPTRLAGECLQPLGHLSGPRNLSVAPSGLGG